MVPTNDVEAGKTVPLEAATTFFGVFPRFCGLLAAAFRDLGAYGKESWEMSENKVVHHNGHYRKLLTWFECLIGH
jgi:hypothetical protein